jgi:putative glutamine amidotransferase
MRPRILATGGLRLSDSGAPTVWLPRTYANAVWRAGGLPVLACVPQGEDLAAEFHGLLLTGGEDPDPASYGQKILNGSVVVNPERDQWERVLFDAFMAAGKPILGICRGIQALNVFLSGTLIQDLPAQLGISHSNVTHMVRAVPGGLPYALFGDTFLTNSIHHQAVDRLGDGLTATAFADDGIVEAFELRTRPVWGIQWHPERMAPENPLLPDHGRIFERFVTQCKVG